MMDPLLILVILLIALLVMLFLGVPIGYALFIVAFIGLTTHLGFGPASALLRESIISETQSYLFSTIPMFVLMAIVLNECGLLTDVFDAMDQWTRGVLPGGLAIGTTVANGGFAALSGSSTAAAASVAKIAQPEMNRLGYDDRLTMGTVAASGTFAMMFPPSLALIIYGIITETSIGRLFIAGIVPGLLTLISYVLLITLWVRYDSTLISKEQPEPVSWNKRLQSISTLWPAGLLIVAVLGSIYGGVVTPTEAGAFGAVGAFIIAITLYDLTLEQAYSALVETAVITSFIYIIILGANYFSRYLAATGFIRELVTSATQLGLGTYSLLGILIIAYIGMGMFINQLPILVLTLPITYPAMVDGFGLSPLLFGIIVIKTVEIGMITPPLGVNVFVASTAVELDPSIGFRGSIRFVLADLAVLLLIIAFPILVLFLPNLM